MRLVSNWKRVLKHSSNLRLIEVAGLLTGAEALLPFIFPAERITDDNRTWIAIITFVVIVAAYVARLIAQEKVAPNADE
jgi:hypothetical protein